MFLFYPEFPFLYQKHLVFFAMTARLANKTSYQDKGFGNKVLFSP